MKRIASGMGEVQSKEQRRLQQLRNSRRHRAKRKKFGQVHAQQFEEIRGYLMKIRLLEDRRVEYMDLKRLNMRGELQFKTKSMLLNLVLLELQEWFKFLEKQWRDMV